MMARNIPSPYENEISSWHENFLCLDDNYFFTIMRLYLGELKTPYNKQKLVLQLEGFLRKEETQKNIVALLSQKDIQILCAVKFIPNATQEKLRDFFAGDLEEDALQNCLSELCARLLIYKDESSPYDNVYKITPLLNDALKGVLQSEKLFPEHAASNSKGKSIPKGIAKKLGIEAEAAANSDYSSKNPAGSLLPVARHKSPNGEETLNLADCVSVELLGAFIAYIAANPKLTKLDGTLKKKAEEEIKEKFPGQIKRLRLLARALVNLELAKDTDGTSAAAGGFELCWNKLESFAKLENREQLIYLLTAAPAHYTKERARFYAQIFLNAINALPKGGFKESVFLRYAYFLAATNSAGTSNLGTSRFARILASHSQNNFAMNDSLNAFFERMLDDAITLGIVNAVPVYYDQADDVDTPLYKIIFKNENFCPSSASKSAMIHIDSVGNITLMQGFEFSKILQLAKFADAVKFDTVAQFEITRDSAIRAFDCGMNSEKIISFIKENSGFDIPNALEFSIKEWEASYKSVSVYNGFVIKLDEKCAAILEKNKIFTEHIFERLAPTVFLLDCKNENEVSALLAKCGIQDAGKIKGAEEVNSEQKFLPLTIEKPLCIEDTPSSSKGSATPFCTESSNVNLNIAAPSKPIRAANDKGIECPKSKDAVSEENALQSLYDQIDALNLNDEQKNTLRDIAASKIIVNSSQLCAPAIPVEKNSAQGMDYNGKVHVIEQAIHNREQILFRLSKNAPLQTGLPTGTDRTNFNDGIYVNIFIGNSQKKYSIGKIEFVQRLRRRII